jgi:outer membrane protein TolC
VADVRLGVSIPLLRDRGGASSAAAEQAAARDHEAARWGLRNTAAQQVLAAVGAYWDYQAAHERLEVLRSSEARADRTVEETRTLVAADERTPADLIQLRGNAASKRVARISAEQDLINARTTLGLAMGLPADAIAVLPSGDWPWPGGMPGAPSRLVEQVLATRRPAAADQRAARHPSEAARSDPRPRPTWCSTRPSATEADDGIERFLTVNSAATLEGLVELRLESCCPTGRPRPGAEQRHPRAADTFATTSAGVCSRRGAGHGGVAH